MDKRYDLGMIGLGVMGKGLAENFERHGFRVLGFDIRKQEDEGQAYDIVSSVEGLVAQLKSPRIVMLMVPAGKAVDLAIDALRPYLAPGDIVMDGGNSYFEDTHRRGEALSTQGVHFVDVGISGGEQGALWGPSLMIGCAQDVWPALKPMFLAIAAKAPDGVPCAAWLGREGAGHFVKMVHNGIEYGEMQLISESFDLLHRGAGFSYETLAKVFAGWNQDELNGYLLQITSQVLMKEDPVTGGALVGRIMDKSEQKGTGKWTSQTSLDVGSAIPTISAAVESRLISGLKEERVRASQQLGVSGFYQGNVRHLVSLAEKALYASKIILYAQSVKLLVLASDKYGWELEISRIMRIWRAGCIIRAAMLDDIAAVYENHPDLDNLILDQGFKAAVLDREAALREVLKVAIDLGVPMMAHSNSLAYFDAYRSAVLPANLIQAQRDFFGAHTYERVDLEGTFHTQWEVA